MASTLFFFTKRYPYGNSEAFVHNEIPYLAQAFDRIVLCPLEEASRNKEGRPLPTNVEVYPLWERPELPKVQPSLFMNEFLTEIRRSPYRWKYLKGFPFYFQELRKAEELASAILEMVRAKTRKGDRSCFYTFWFYGGALALSILRRKGLLPGFVSRCHLGDLYDETVPGRFVPFNRVKVEHVSQLFSVSQHGAQYLKEHYPLHHEKVQAAYLGVKDHGLSPIGEPSRYRIVSCSTISRRKRVTRIPDILEKVGLPIEWVHFGEGGQREVLEERIRDLPEHVHVGLKGKVSNEEIRAFYRANTVHLFVNVSRAEGLPVTLMETAGHGIPSLAPDVYGNREAVTEESGILMGPSPAPEKAAKKIREFLSDPEAQKIAREKARRIYESRFDASVNYPAFAKALREEFTFELGDGP